MKSFFVLLLILTFGSVLPEGQQADTLQIDQLNARSYVLREVHIDSSRQLALAALALASEQRYEPGVIDGHNNLAWVFYRQNEYSQALNHAHQALLSATKRNYHRGLALAYVAIAACYFDLELAEEAKEFTARALAAALKSADKRLMSRLQCTYGIALYGLDKLDSSELISRQAMEFSTKINDPEMIAFAYRNLGDIRTEQDRFPDALEYYLAAHENAVRIRNHYLLASLGHRIGKSLLAVDRRNEALPNLERSLQLAEQYQYRDEYYYTCLVMEDYYADGKDFRSAYAFADKARASNAELSRQMTLLYGKLERQHNQHQVELLRTNTALQSEKIKSQRVLLISSTAGVTMFALLVFALVRTNCGIKKTNDRLRANEAELAKINSNKDILFAILSHDLRAPIASLRGITQLMIHQQVNAEQLQDLGRQLNYKIGLVEDHLQTVLHWSNSQLNDPESARKVIPVNNCIEELRPLYSELAKNKEIRIAVSLESKANILADPDQVCIILRNLLSNAIKFTEAGGEIRVSTIDEADGVMIRISDSGVGMSAEEVQRILSDEPVKSQLGTKNEKGFGIGLALCKEFRRKNGGRWTINSQLGQGTVFSLHFKRV
jgi:signal transduction histidine kinase